MAPSALLAHPLPDQAAGAWSRCLTRLVTSPPYRCMGAPGMPRHVASPGGPSAVQGVIEVDGCPQKREPIVPRDLVGTELREEHRFEANIDIDLLEQLLHHLSVLAGEFNGRGALQLNLAPVDFALLFLVSRQELFGMRHTLRHVGTVADQLAAHLPGHSPGPQGIAARAGCASLIAQFTYRFTPPR